MLEIEHHFAKHRTVVGGGILQDAGGFVASTLYRGVPWDLIPTTLLAQADSCIGAKTSVNLTWAKDLIGTFSAPQSALLTPQASATGGSGRKFSRGISATT